MRKQSVVFAAGLLVLALVGRALPAAKSKTSTPPADTPLRATITDTEDKKYKVVDLRATYSAAGSWLGGRPERDTTELSITLFITEDRVTTEEHLAVQLSKAKRLQFDLSELPPDLDVPTAARESLQKFRYDRFDMTDGTVFMLSSSVLVTFPKNKEAPVAKTIEKFSIRSGEYQGVPITFDGFSGRSKTKSGKEGSFSIHHKDVKTIEFD